MKSCLLSLLLGAIAVLGGIGSAQAQTVYTEGAGGMGGRGGANHVEFALQFNIQLDDSDGINNGGGFWLSYRRNINQFFSIGGKFGAHGYSIDNNGFKDSVSSAPLLFVAQVERNFDRAVTIFFNIGMGPSFNQIEGDATDLLDIELKTSFAFDLSAGATVEMSDNVAIGLNLDYFLSSAPVDSPSTFVDDHLNISHFGIGLIAVFSF